MAQVKKKFIGADQVDETKIRLTNNVNLRARNAANSADVNIAKVNASDRIEFASVPQVTADAATGNDLVRKSQFDSGISSITPATNFKETLTLSGTDITNQYVDLTHLQKTNSMIASVDGIMGYEGEDYTLSAPGSVTRVTFAGDWATGGAAALVSGDKIRFKYQY
jgi:hypothetical protein